MSALQQPAGKASDDVKRLIALGYRRVSNKYGIVSRIDRPDWLKILARKMFRAVADFYTHDGEISSMWPDHYRRVYSKDRLILDIEKFRLIPGSDHDRATYVDPDSLDESIVMVKRKPVVKTALELTSEECAWVQEALLLWKQYFENCVGNTAELEDLATLNDCDRLVEKFKEAAHGE